MASNILIEMTLCTRCGTWKIPPSICRPQEEESCSTLSIVRKEQELNRFTENVFAQENGDLQV